MTEETKAVLYKRVVCPECGSLDFRVLHKCPVEGHKLRRLQCKRCATHFKDVDSVFALVKPATRTTTS